MTVYLLGDWQQATSLWEGFEVLQGLWTATGGMWWFKVFLLITWGWMIWHGVTKKKPMMAFWVVLLPVYFSIIAKPVEVKLPAPASSPSLTSTIQAAESRVANAKNVVEVASNELGQPNLDFANQQLQAAQDDLARLQSLERSGSIPSAKVPAGFAFPFQLVNTLAVWLWTGIDSVTWSDIQLQDRSMQAAITQQLADVPNLSPLEKQVVEQLGKCLIQKQKYAEQTAKVAVYVSQGLDPDSGRVTPRTGEALADAWAEVLLPSREAVKNACVDMSKSLADAIDNSITEADVKDFTSGYMVPLVGEVGAPSRADKVAYVAGLMGLPVDQVEGKSDEELSRMFLRFKKYSAVSESLQDNMDQLGSGVAGGGMNAAGGFVASIGSWVSEFFGNFMLIVKPITLKVINFGFFLLPIAFFFTVLRSLWPMQFEKAWASFFIGVVILFAWQLSVLLITKYIAHEEQMQVGMAADKSGIDGAMQIVEASWDGITGGAETMDVAAAGSVAGKASVRQIGKQVITKILSVAPKQTPHTALITGIAIGTVRAVDGVQQLGEDQKEFAKLMIEDGGLNPVLEGLAGGLVDRQREKVRDQHDKLALLEAILLVGSFAFAGALTWGGWRSVGSINGGEAARMGEGLGGMVLNRIPGGMGKGGGR